MAEKTAGYTTITYKMRLYDKHHDWLMLTKELYNQVVWHYYEYLMQEPQLLELSNFLLLRTAEERSVGTKVTRSRQEEPPWKLEGFPKIPLYFRRAAINAAIGLARSYQGLQENWKESSDKGKAPSFACTVQSAPVFYKGMYRDFTKESITLKLFTGSRWKWISLRYTGRELPEVGKQLSPVLKVGKKDAWLHIPVMHEVYDIRTIRERMQTENKIMAVCFPDNDYMAVSIIMNSNGSCLDCRTFRGGAERKGKLRLQIQRLEKAGQDKNSDQTAIRKKITDINTHYAHEISRQILSYAKENQITVIAASNTEQRGTEEPRYNINQKSLARQGAYSPNYSWIGRKILRYLKYKAFQEGILVGTVWTYQISQYCSKCGSQIRRYNHKLSKEAANVDFFCPNGKLFVCENGHRGNYAWNEAKMTGIQFWIYHKIR